MKIAIPTITSTQVITGVAEYLINLIDGLQRVDDTNEYVIITCPENRYMFHLWKWNFREKIVNIPYNPRFIMMPLYHLWQSFIFVSWCKKSKIDLVHLPNTLFVSKRINSIITIHDLAEFYFPRYSIIRNAIRRQMIKSAIHNAKRIIAVSNSTRQDLKILGAANVKTIYNGFSGKDTNDYNNNILSTCNISHKKYFIFVGSLIKHKNVLNLLIAFNLFVRKNPTIKLVLCGNRGNAYDEIVKFLVQNNLKDNIVLTGYIDELSKKVLIKNAIALTFLSYYEGFGFPIVEAQSLGTPVIISNTSSLPEIAGDSAFVTTPDDIIGIVSLLEKLNSNPNGFTENIEKGYENLLRFSWALCSVTTLQTYYEASE